MTTQQIDPFAGSTSTPSVSFKDAPVGTSYTGSVLEAPSVVQARDYETGDPAFWPDGNPKMTVVTKLKINGEERSLWAPKPSAMFAAIAAAQQEAGQLVTVGGTLTVTYTGDKPNEKNPRLNPAKQYTVKYVPGDAFSATEQGQVDKTTGEITQPPTLSGPTPEAIAALKAAGIDPNSVYPGSAG